MKRPLTNFWLDIVSFLAMLGLAFTGGIVHWVLPAGQGRTRSLFGLGRHDYGNIHFCLALVAVLVLTLHVWLHWSWVCCALAKVTRKDAPSPARCARWGATILISTVAVLGLGLWWASSQVVRYGNL